MDIHEVRGKTMRDALERARENIGEDAVVVSHQAAEEGGVQLAVARGVPEDPRVINELKTRADRMLARKPARPMQPGTRDIQRSLEATGVSPLLIDRICEAVAGRLEEGGHPLDLAAEEIGMVFPIARARRAAGMAHVFAFFGHTGVGKTTSIAKLAARLVRGRRQIALATLDTGQVGGVEQLRAYAQALKVPLIVLKHGHQLVGELENYRGLDVVLLDTTGQLEADVAELEALRTALEQSKANAVLQTYVVASATSAHEAHSSATRTASKIAPVGSVITKLDETRVAGPLLEHVLVEKLPVAFFSDGPDIARNFHRSAPDHFADLLLRGRIS